MRSLIWTGCLELSQLITFIKLGVNPYTTSLGVLPVEAFELLSSDCIQGRHRSHSVGFSRVAMKKRSIISTVWLVFSLCPSVCGRSEERRVGKECRCRRARDW